VVQLWVEIRAQGANEASEFENARADAAETQETAGGAAREPQPSDEAERGQQAARRGGRPRENEWAAWVDYVAEDIAKNGPLGRKKGKFVLSRAVQLGLDFFPPPQPSAAAIYKWLKAHPDEWQPRWGVKPEEYDEPTGP
jgi:hypothetical protein